MHLMRWSDRTNLKGYSSASFRISSTSLNKSVISICRRKIMVESNSRDTSDCREQRSLGICAAVRAPPFLAIVIDPAAEAHTILFVPQTPHHKSTRGTAYPTSAADLSPIVLGDDNQGERGRPPFGNRIYFDQEKRTIHAKAI